MGRKEAFLEQTAGTNETTSVGRCAALYLAQQEFEAELVHLE